MSERELKELQAMKKLLVLQLLTQDIKADAIADLLGIEQGDFSRMFPAQEAVEAKGAEVAWLTSKN